MKITKNKMGKFGLILILVFSITLISAVPTFPNSLHVTVQYQDSSGTVQASTNSILEFNITSDAGCINVLYTNRTNQTSDANGIVSYTLENVNLNFTETFYFCYYRSGDLKSNSTISMSPYAYTAKNVSASGVMADSNLDLSGYNVTADNFCNSTSCYNVTAFFDDTDTSYNATYDAYKTNVSKNYTKITYDIYDNRWYQILWDATFNASFDDRDTDTTYTAGSNLTLSGTEFSVNMVKLVEYLKTLFLELSDNLDWGNLINKPANLDEDSTDDLTTSDLPLENRTKSHCTNITGATSNLCTLTDTDTVDGNASSICAGDTTYLSGEGNCNDLSSVYWPFGSGSYNATYDAYSTNVSINYTQRVYDNWNTDWLSTYNATYDSYKVNASMGDSFINETGDNMTGNLNMVNANITFGKGNITIWYNGTHLIIE